MSQKPVTLLSPETETQTYTYYCVVGPHFEVLTDIYHLRHFIAQGVQLTKYCCREPARQTEPGVYQLKNFLSMSRRSLFDLKTYTEFGINPHINCQISMDTASKRNDTRLLQQWIGSSYPLKYSPDALDIASELGHTRTVKWWFGNMHNPRTPLKYTLKAIHNATLNGKSEILDLWRNHGLLTQTYNITKCIARGDFDYDSPTVQWWYQYYGDEIRQHEISMISRFLNSHYCCQHTFAFSVESTKVQIIQ